MYYLPPKDAKIEDDDEDDNPKKRLEKAMAERAREKGRHVFLIGKKFSPTESWPGIPNIKLKCHLVDDYDPKNPAPKFMSASGPEGIDEPPPIQRICNVNIEFAVRVEVRLKS